MVAFTHVQHMGKPSTVKTFLFSVFSYLTKNTSNKNEIFCGIFWLLTFLLQNTAGLQKAVCNLFLY